jgi:methyl-accepting chemotaxis protein
MMSLAKALMNNLTYPKKMMLIAFIFLIPLSVTFFILFDEMNVGIKATQTEKQGLEYISKLRLLYQNIPQHRGMTNAYLNGNASFKAKILAKRNDIKADMSAIDAVDAEYGEKFDATARWNNIKQTWTRLEARAFEGDADTIFAEHSLLVSRIYDLFEHISNKSGLILDPDIDTTFIIETMVYKLPLVTENLGQTRGFASGIAAQGVLSIDQHVKLESLTSKIIADNESVGHALYITMEATPALEAKLDPLMEAQAAALNTFMTTLHEDIVDTNLMTIGANEVFAAGTEAIKAAYALYDALVPTLDNLLDERIEELRWFRNMISLGLIIVIAFSFYIFLGFYQTTDTAIRQLIDASNRVAEGDLTFQIKLDTRDETSQIAIAMNKMTMNLSQIVGRVQSDSNTLSSAAEELSATTHQAKSNTERQQTESEQIATAMNEMTSTVKEIARNAEMLAQEVGNASTETHTGEQIINATITTINSLAEGVGSAADSVRDLVQSSDEIASVLTVIKGVTEQTNLLALNAAIEAARAGEHGRGFAVVADEVRQLAHTTQQSAEQIENMIVSLQDRTKRAADLMNQETENAHHVSTETANATVSMENIVAAINRISDMSMQVASAAEQQGLVSEEINRNVTQVSDLAYENLSGSEQISAASGELSRLAEDLQSMVKQFKVS